ncbi:MAG: cation transporter [Bacteroidetes bacterium]|nr:cation transporter [Bacteroidota bacterium]
MKIAKKTNSLPQLEGWLSIFINILLFILKYWAGIVTGSIAILADAWHTLSDSFTSIIVLVGVKLANKPANKEHPFGFGRAELIASIIISVLLFVVGFNFIIESIAKLSDHEITKFGNIAIIATSISIILKEAMAEFAFWASKKADSSVLRADAWHHRSDAISSLIILFGVFFGKYFWWIDGVLGIIVAFLIFYAAYEILKQTINPLIGTRPDDKLIQKIKNICNNISKSDVFIHHIHMHNYGKYIEITFHIQLPGKMKLEDAHNIANNIEKEIRKKLNIEATIHMEPIGDEEDN